MNLINTDELTPWMKTWRGMPEFHMEDKEPALVRTMRIAKKDIEKFSKITGQKITPATKGMWYPPRKLKSIMHLGYVSDEKHPLKYPIYILSYGRHEARLTSRRLEVMNIPYRIVVEPCEYDLYAKVIDPKKIICAPEDFHLRGQGSIPVRNFIWEHVIEEGWAERYWLLDDNIVDFFRMTNNSRLRVKDGTMFRCMEDFADRYSNVAFVGPHHIGFCPDRIARQTPYTMNTRVYSCTLMKTDLSYRWRGKYNEDTDLMLRALKDGWATFVFKAFIMQKAATGAAGGAKGGNAATVYNTGDRRRAFAESLKEQHPDVTTVVEKFQRWHHSVDYRRFEDNDPGLIAEIPEGINNYGMKLININEKEISDQNLLNNKYGSAEEDDE
jgi:hypothetical protein